MRKEPELSSRDYVQHTRNSSRGAAVPPPPGAEGAGGEAGGPPPELQGMNEEQALQELAMALMELGIDPAALAAAAAKGGAGGALGAAPPMPKEGLNRAKRHAAKQALSQSASEAAAPVKSKLKKRFGIKQGKFCNWYATEKARNTAYEAALKAQRIMMGTWGHNATLSQHHGRPITKVER